MKLAPDTLVAIIEILRKGIVDGIDISEMLRGLELVQNEKGELSLTESSSAIVKAQV